MLCWHKCIFTRPGNWGGVGCSGPSWGIIVTWHVMGYGGMGYGGSKKNISGYWLFAVQRNLWMNMLREKMMNRTCNCENMFIKTHIF